MLTKLFTKNKEKDRQNNLASQKPGRNKKYQFKARKKALSFNLFKKIHAT
jgi:hypothetical protein